MRFPCVERSHATLPSRLVVLLGLASVLLTAAALADEPPLPTVAKVAVSNKVGPFRAIVPGVEVTIAPDRQEEETTSTRDIVEILQGIPGLDWKPKLAPDTQTLREMATQTVFRREIWCLELTFKPPRMLWVDVPQASGKMQRKLIWYMIYHVKNTGGNLKPVRQQDATYTLTTVDREVRFFPQFVLESEQFKKAYLDRIIPVAIPAIQQKEDPNRKLLNSVEISSKQIPLSSELVDHSVWGVVTWEDIDPRVDYFSIYVQGLSNAFKWVDLPEANKPGETPAERGVLLQKTLVLNFWRPGDEYVEDRRIIRYGIPGKVDYNWVYP